MSLLSANASGSHRGPIKAEYGARVQRLILPGWARVSCGNKPPPHLNNLDQQRLISLFMLHNHCRSAEAPLTDSGTWADGTALVSNIATLNWGTRARRRTRIRTEMLPPGVTYTCISLARTSHVFPLNWRGDRPIILSCAQGGCSEISRNRTGDYHWARVRSFRRLGVA